MLSSQNKLNKMTTTEGGCGCKAKEEGKERRNKERYCMFCFALCLSVYRKLFKIPPKRRWRKE